MIVIYYEEENMANREKADCGSSGLLAWEVHNVPV